jgi:hypothetical protein
MRFLPWHPRLNIKYDCENGVKAHLQQKGRELKMDKTGLIF